MTPQKSAPWCLHYPATGSRACEFAVAARAAWTCRPARLPRREDTACGGWSTVMTISWSTMATSLMVIVDSGRLSARPTTRRRAACLSLREIVPVHGAWWIKPTRHARPWAFWIMGVLLAESSIMVPAEMSTRTAAQKGSRCDRRLRSGIDVSVARMCYQRKRRRVRLWCVRSDGQQSGHFALEGATSPRVFLGVCHRSTWHKCGWFRCLSVQGAGRHTRGFWSAA